MKAALIMPVAEGIGQSKWDWFRRYRALVDLDRLDSASRGPWGSFLLLFTNYNHYLASFGALIIIVALAIGPFSQQVINYTNCLQPQNALPAFISTTTNYLSLGTFLTNSQAVPENRMANPIYQGLLDPPANASSSIFFSCQTGNCTFPEDNGATHMSLAMCGECADISSSIIVNHTQNAQDGATGNILSGPAIQYVIPSNDALYPSPSVLKYNNSDGSEQVFNWLGIQPYSQFKETPTSDDLAPGFKAIMFQDCSCVGNGTTANSSCVCEPFATNCSLSPCVKTYHAEVKNFILNETELSSVKIPDTDNYYFWWLEEALRGGKWSPCSNSTQESPEYSIPFISVNETDGSIAYTQGGCFWTFGSWTALALRGYFASNIWLGGLTGSQINTGPGTASGSAWLQPLFNNGSATMDTVNDYIDRLANAMTAVMRQHGDRPGSMTVSGTTYQNQTCINVRWAWLSLPASLLVLTCVFLTITIWKTESRQAVVWKSSPLALFYHAPDDDFQTQHSALVQIESMRNAARSTEVQIQQQQNTWRFVARSRSHFSGWREQSLVTCSQSKRVRIYRLSPIWIFDLPRKRQRLLVDVIESDENNRFP